MRGFNMFSLLYIKKNEVGRAFSRQEKEAERI
jgi:hypothetical protein